jgi:hypothetical protein
MSQKKNNNNNNNNNAQIENKETNNNNKEDETKATKVVMKVDMHCEGCSSKIVKCIYGFEGFSFSNCFITFFYFIFLLDYLFLFFLIN